MIIWMASARRTDSSGGRRDRLVVRVGVQAVAVVVERAERLQRRADVVEGHLLGVQRAAGRLHVVLELLGALVGAVALAHRDGPDAPGDPAEHRVLGVHAVAEEEREVRREVVDVHPAREVRLDVGEAIREGEGELAQRVRPRFSDVVARDRHRVEVADPVRDEPFLDVGHAPQGELGGEDARVLALVLLEDVGLHGAAHLGEDVRANPGRLLFGWLGRSFSARERLEPLVDRRVEEHGENRRSRTVDGHRHRGRWASTGRSRSRAPSCRRASRWTPPRCRPCRRCRGARSGSRP